MTSDSVAIVLANNQVDSLVLYGACFIISLDDTITESFNQVKGLNIIAYFNDNEMVKIRVSGNAETLYYMREEDLSLIGVQKAISNSMIIYFHEGEINGITYIDKVDGAIFPYFDLLPQDLILRDFIWIEGRRPLKKEDVFNW